jgi:hypothetical protein
MKVGRNDKRVFVSIWLLLFAGSCHKTIPYSCEGNCQVVHFSGTVADASTNQPLVNQPVNIGLYQNVFCLLCPPYQIASGPSDKNGRFEFSKEFDTSMLKNDHIDVSVTVSENYILYPDFPGSGSQSAEKVEFYTADTAQLNHIFFGFYPKALLKINLHRISPVVPEQPYIILQISFNTRETLWSFMMSDNNKDTTVMINTSANIYTKIISQKFMTLNDQITNTDSIRCTVTGNNSIDIDY